MRKLLLSLLLVGIGVLTGCGSSGGGNTPTTPTLQLITVTPTSPSLTVGATQQFTATGTYSDGSTKNLTTSANWTSSSSTVAAITTGGLATAVGGGTSTITAASGSVSGATTLTVANPLKSIAVTPGSASVAPNGTQQFTATGTFADGTTQDLTTTATWNASTGATITAGGLATGVTPNATATIMAAQGSISGTATLAITNPLKSIAVTPAAPQIANGTTVSFIATGTYADNSTSVITSTVAWASSNPAIATISNSPGTQGVANGIKAGTTSITATSGTVVSSPVTLTVTSATLVSIAVTPVNQQLVLLQPPAVQYTATGKFNDGTTQDITSDVMWSSSDTTKISITQSGAATGVGTTTAPVTITATFTPPSGPPVSGSTTATVIPPTVNSISIAPSTAASNPSVLAMGTSRQYKATASLANGSTLNVTNLATWSSSDTTAATVTAGLVKAANSLSAPKSVNIIVKYNGVTQTLPLTISTATASTITVTPIAPTIPVGVIQGFSATAQFSDGSTQDITQSVTWASSVPTVATITFTGIATGISSPPAPNNTTMISATFGTTIGAATLTVSADTLSTISVSPVSTVLAPGSTLNYQAVGTYAPSGSKFFITSLAAWASDSASVTVTSSGIATGQTAGLANITAKYQGVTSNAASALVTPSPLASITVTPSPSTLPPTIPEGVSMQFAAIGVFQNGSTQNLTTNVIWTSDQPAIATVSNAVGLQGIGTGVAVGSATISATFAGITGSEPVTVTNAMLTGITIVPSNPTVTAGTQVLFTASGTFVDSNNNTFTLPMTNQVTWSSSDVTIATINNTGIANTVKPGSVTITATYNQNGTPINGTAMLTVQ